MNDFDRYLERELKLLLDPMASRRPPTRRGRSEVTGVPQPPLVVVTPPAAQAPSR